MDHRQRIILAEQIAEKIRMYYQEHLLALGIYGSLARGTDGPYSDIEMFCIIEGEGIDNSYEWSEGEWKAEVNIYSLDLLTRLAGEIDSEWSITHGALMMVQPVYDPQDIFSYLKEVVLSHTEEAFQEAMEDLIVGEVYELVGKLRNSHAQQNWGCVPFFTMDLIKFAACLVGVSNHHLYTSTRKFLEESLMLSDLPQGYETLCILGMEGKLDDPKVILPIMEIFWAGIEEWAAKKSLHIYRKLDDLLYVGDR